jgi:hypothetical protein
MTTKYHPLRPKHGSVLICEDKNDSDFVSAIIRHRTIEITVTHGKGRDTLPKLAVILQPAFYIWDRDFGFSVTDAKATYNDSFRKSRLVWSHVDIESYLLYPDWLFKFIQNAPTSYIKISHPPKAQINVENNLKELASDLVPDHAGRRTVEIVNHSLNMRKRGGFGVPSGILNGRKLSSRADWEKGLESQVKILQNNLQTGANAPELSTILSIYAEQITEYQSFVASFEDIRVNFSGKRILQLLANKWGVVGKRVKRNKLRNWEIIRKRLITYADDYSKEISPPLKDDIRLGDFGKVASKLTGKEI